MSRRFAVPAGAVALALAGAQPGFAQTDTAQSETAGADIGYSELLSADLSRWSIEAADSGNLSVADGRLRVAEPAGWLKSDRQYADFALRTEFRFLTDDADSGLFVRARGTSSFARGWPNQSYQVQLRNPIGESPFPPVGGLFRHGMPAGETDFDETAARRASRPTGEWQTLEIVVAGDALTATLNGTLLTSAAGIENPTGFIGVQAETGTLEFRSLAIRELPPGPSPQESSP